MEQSIHKITKLLKEELRKNGSKSKEVQILTLILEKLIKINKELKQMKLNS